MVLATSLAATGLAVLVGGLARTESQVAIVGTLVVVTLAGLSGSMLPRELLPETVRQLSLLTPHAWALDAYARLLAPGAGAVDSGRVWQCCGVLAGSGRRSSG